MVVLPQEVDEKVRKRPTERATGRPYIQGDQYLCFTVFRPSGGGKGTADARCRDAAVGNCDQVWRQGNGGLHSSQRRTAFGALRFHFSACRYAVLRGSNPVRPPLLLNDHHCPMVYAQEGGREKLSRRFQRAPNREIRMYVLCHALVQSVSSAEKKRLAAAAEETPEATDILDLLGCGSREEPKQASKKQEFVQSTKEIIDAFMMDSAGISYRYAESYRLSAHLISIMWPANIFRALRPLLLQPSRGISFRQNDDRDSLQADVSLLSRGACAIDVGLILPLRSTQTTSHFRNDAPPPAAGARTLYR